jgi:hypothetical protein
MLFEQSPSHRRIVVLVYVIRVQCLCLLSFCHSTRVQGRMAFNGEEEVI